MEKNRGIVYKSIGGFYTVKAADGQLVECKPRGIFRKDKLRIVVGDEVRLAAEAGTVFIDEVLPRKNVFVRPPVANVDRFFIVVSTVEPTPSFLVIDKLSAVAFDQDARVALVVTKGDLASPLPVEAAYATSGIPVVAVHAESGEGLGEVRRMLAGEEGAARGPQPDWLNVFCGNSGVGKSTLLNALLPEAQRQTGEISQKLGRGRHTTREVEIFEVEGGLVADTPGFASFDVQRASPILAENLQLAFPEIKQRIGQCKFSGCAHLSEPGCAVREAVKAGGMAQSRYDSYVALYREAKEAEAAY